MNYLQRKRYALMQNKRFHGYLRTATGNPLTITDCMRNGLVSLDIYGNSVQDGTPTPDAPVEIQAVGDFRDGKYTIPIAIAGNNLFDLSYVKKPDNWINDNGGRWVIPLKLEAGKVYTVCGENLTTDTSRAAVRFVKRNGAGSYVHILELLTNTVTSCRKSFASFTANGTEHIYIYSPNNWIHSQSSLNTVFNDFVTGIQIVEGSYTTETMPDYEPYIEPYKFNIYIDEPLYKMKLAANATGYYDFIDDDGNKILSDHITLDVRNKRAALNRNLKMYECTGNEVMRQYVHSALTGKNYYIFYSYFPNIRTFYVDNNTARYHFGSKSIMANTIPLGTSIFSSIAPFILAGTVPGDFANLILVGFLKEEVDKHGLSTVAENMKAYWKSFAENVGCKMLYITNPITTDISDQIDWDAIRQTPKGTVKITAGTTIQPSNMTAQYYSDKEGQ